MENILTSDTLIALDAKQKRWGNKILKKMWPKV